MTLFQSHSVWRDANRDELPNDVIAIGGDPFGNLFVMGLEDHRVN
jgi:hypothetical protein